MANQIKIKSGDTLSQIAQTHGTSVNDILKANPNIKDPNVIMAGASLSLPGTNNPVSSNAIQAPTANMSVPTPQGNQSTNTALQALNINDSVGQLLNGSQQDQQQVTPPPPRETPKETIKIPQGSNLSSLARQYGTSVNEIMRLNPQIKNPNMIFAGSNLNIPIGSQVKQQETREQQIAQISEEVNQQQQQLMDSVSIDEIPQRNSAQMMNQLFERMVQSSEQPEPLRRLDTYNQLREDMGLDPLETRLRELDAQIEEIQTSALVGSDVAGDRPVNMAAIGRRRSAIEREAQRELAFINLERSAIAREVEGKLSSVEMIMSFTEADYKDSVRLYENEYKRSMDMINLFTTMEDRDMRMEDRVMQNAQANLQTMTNMIQSSGKSFADLSDIQMSEMRKWEMEAGFPTGTFEAFGVAEPQAKVLHSSKSFDASGNEIVTFIYEDPNNPGRPGTIEVVPTGGRERKTSGSTERSDRVMTPAEVKSFADSYGWRPIGMTLNEANQTMTQNPDLTIRELEELTGTGERKLDNFTFESIEAQLTDEDFLQYAKDNNIKGLGQNRKIQNAKDEIKEEVEAAIDLGIAREEDLIKRFKA